VVSVKVAFSILVVTEVTVGVSDCCDVPNVVEFCCGLDCVVFPELVSVEDEGAGPAVAVEESAVDTRITSCTGGVASASAYAGIIERSRKINPAPNIK
jgi:hypothetical protein